MKDLKSYFSRCDYMGQVLEVVCDFITKNGKCYEIHKVDVSAVYDNHNLIDYYLLTIHYY